MNQVIVLNMAEEKNKSLLFKRYLKGQERILFDEFCGHRMDIAA